MLAFGVQMSADGAETGAAAAALLVSVSVRDEIQHINPGRGNNM